MEHAALWYIESLHMQISIYNGTATTTLEKFNIINTLNHRAKTVSSNAEHLITEEEQFREVLTKCKYPTWTLEWMQSKNIHQGRPDKYINNKTKGYIVIPYYRVYAKP